MKRRDSPRFHRFDRRAPVAPDQEGDVLGLRVEAGSADEHAEARGAGPGNRNDSDSSTNRPRLEWVGSKRITPGRDVMCQPGAILPNNQDPSGGSSAVTILASVSVTHFQPVGAGN